MTTSAAIRTAWTSRIWTNSTVMSWTEKVFLHDVLIESQLNATELYDPLSATINFFTCTIARETELLVMNQYRQTFQARVFYHLQQADVADDMSVTLIDRLEAVDDLVRTELTSTWNSTVDYYTGSTFQELREVTLDGKRCWRGGYIYTAIKTI